MKKAFVAAMAISMMVSTAASAAVVVSSTVATNPYSGPTPTYDFETPAPVTGGSIVTGSIGGQHLAPFGSTGNYLSVGPIDGASAVINLSAFDKIASISFLWGSMDSYNLFELLDAANNVIFSVNGQDVKDLKAAQPGNVNRVVTFTFDDATTQSAVNGARLTSSLNAFEIDNFSIRAVPEPTTWLMMILGFFGLSYAMRSRKEKITLRVRYT